MITLRVSILAIALAACGSSSTNNQTIDAGSVTSPDAAPGPHYCQLADCTNGFARTCDQDPLTLDCSSFGGRCTDFTDPDNLPFSWCGCGPIAEGQGRCLDGRNGVTCDQGLGAPAQCAVGTRCVVDSSQQYGLACDCDDISDDVCPDPACTDDPDCMHCTPSCAGKECGDNGCGGQCGSCGLGSSCEAGHCAQICVPNCSGKQCGDDGCGGSCGACTGTSTCTTGGQCMAMGMCVPSCTDKTCGNDGCGGSCGTCGNGLTCTDQNTCGCGFFDQVKYTFTLDPNASWPASFTFLALNVQHIDLDGTLNSNNNNGAFMRLIPISDATFKLTVYGCKPNIEIKRDYALNGIDCKSDQTIVGRTDFVIPAPIINSDGSCTAPPL